MSGKIVGQVWDLKLPHNKLIVLLAMADHADHEGGNIYPSMDLIAWKTGYSERHVRRIVKTLEDDGILTKTERPGYTNVYSMNLSAGQQKEPFKSDNVTPDKMSDPIEKEVIEGGHPDVRPPLTPRCPTTPDTQMSDEPSYNRHITNIIADAKPDQKVISLPDVGKIDGDEKQELDTSTKDAKQLIATYKSYSKNKDGSMFGWALSDAKELIKSSITPDDIKAWYEERSKDDWIKQNLNGIPTWRMMVSEIITHRDKLKLKQAKQKEPAKKPIMTRQQLAEQYNFRIIQGLPVDDLIKIQEQLDESA